MAEGEIAKGAATGGFKGGSVGLKVGMNPALLAATGGLSAPIGAVGGALIGGTIGGVKAKKSQDEREKGLQLPGSEDPTQTARRLEIDRIAKNIQSGSDSATQTAIGQAAQTTAQTQSRLARVTGGSSGATTDALLKAQRAGGTAANQAIAQGQSRLPFFMNLGQQLANRQEQRKLELDLLARAQTSAETAQDQKERNVNSNALLASGLGGSNIEGQGGRIQSLTNQGIGKIQGDIETSPTEISTIDNAPGAGSLPSLSGAGDGGAAGGGLPIDASAFAGGLPIGI